MVEYVSLDDEVRAMEQRKKVVLRVPRTAVVPLIFVNIVMFVLQFLIPNFTENLVMISSDIFARPWILLTTMFLHGSFAHIFFNMYALLLFGLLLEQKIGWKKFFGLYIISGLLVSFISSYFYTSALGASGAVMGVIGTLIVLMPKLRLLFFFLIPMPLWVAGVIWFLLDFLGMFSSSTGIAHIGHLVGMFCGLSYGFYLRNQRKKFFKKMRGKKIVTIKDAKEHSKIYR